MWVASTGGAWRLPKDGSDLAIVDDTAAVVRTGPRELVRVDLVTGAIGGVTDVIPAPGVIESIARVGDRVLAFGFTDSGAAVWSIAAAPLAATALAVPDPEPLRPGAAHLAEVTVSADGTRVFVCGARRWPVVRDAVTLAAIRVFTSVDDCRSPHFADADHVVTRTIKPQLLEISTGKVTSISPHGAIAHPGPGGRTLTITDYSSFRFTDGAGRLVGEARGYGAPSWIPDGSGVVMIGAGEIVVQPVTGTGDRRIGLPVADGITRHAITPGGVAVLLAGHVVIAVDLAAGTHRTASGNLGRIVRIAPRDDMVVVASDRIRAWRDGQLVANGEPAVTTFTADPPGQPVLTISTTTVSGWDPVTGDRFVLHELAGSGFVIGRARDRILFDDDNVVFKGQGQGRRPPGRWFQYRHDAHLEAMDVAGNTLAWSLDGGFHVADLDRGQVWSFSFPDCATVGTGVRFDPPRGRIGIELGGEIQLVDLGARQRLGGVALDDAGWPPVAWGFVPRTGEVAIAAPGELVLWDPATTRAVSWTLPVAAQPVELGIDATGTAVAIGFADGGVVWARLDAVRAHAKPRAVRLRVPERGGCTTAPRPALDELVISGGDDDGIPGELECNDTNDDPDDDCSVIYGTPEEP
jgi:hypothetical protein